MEFIEYNISRVIAEIQIAESEILNLLLVGSRLHGTASPTSDFDFIMIVSDGTHLPEGHKVERSTLDVTIFTRSEYITKLESGEDWQTLEPLWAPPTCRWIFKEDFLPFYNRDLSKLRVAVSSIANKGHAYAKILMTKESNYLLGKKNLAHEIRNLRLGMQIIDTGSIIDYTETKDIYDLIMAETSTDWTYYNERWGSIAMTHQKEFISKTPEKIKAPKPPKQRKKRRQGTPQQGKDVFGENDVQDDSIPSSSANECMKGV
jgi:predicted nucleotidyltransferase